MDILTSILVIGSLVVLLLVMILIAIWRRGTKYGRLEIARRQQLAEFRAAERRRMEQLYDASGTHGDTFTEWDAQADLDDPPKTP